QLPVPAWAVHETATRAGKEDHADVHPGELRRGLFQIVVREHLRKRLRRHLPTRQRDRRLVDGDALRRDSRNLRLDGWVGCQRDQTNATATTIHACVSLPRDGILPHLAGFAPANPYNARVERPAI